MEGVADGDGAGFVSPFGEQVYGGIHGVAGSAKDALRVAVDVGGDDVAVNLGQRGLHDVQGGEDEGHFAVVVHADFAHFAATGGGGFQIVLEGHNAGSHQRRILPKRMSHYHVRVEAVGLQQPQQRRVQCEHRRLRDLRLHQIKFRLHECVGIVAVHEDIIGQRFAQNRRHHAVRLAEHLRHDGCGADQVAPHVHVLAPLTGEEKGDLPFGRAATAEDALRLQRLPRLRIVEAHHFLRFVQAGQ